MMGHVAEQDQHGQQASGQQPEGQPPQIDSEQLRQFQQFQDFQRFQELQRQADNEPVPVQPPKRRWRAPRWLRMKLKIMAWVIAILLIFFALAATAVIWVVNGVFGSDEEQLPAAKTGGGTYHTNTILATNPYEAVRGVYDAIAKDAEPQACGRFDRQTRRAFAAHLGYANCKQAVQDLHAEVDHVNNYAESIDTNVSKPTTVDQVRISSCESDISGGPALGTFVVARVERGQWLIVGHETGPRQCPSHPTR